MGEFSSQNLEISTVRQQVIEGFMSVIVPVEEFMARRSFIPSSKLSRYFLRM
ncbi:hypothetical protein YSA_05358 [Pseudomonas putida ND6]|uniref:Uncharacterized protein n=1 Tax=Pseudomonas putida ND6 TaxID=231023 RepID=I3UVZ0_PSEPU|nr:hypothetical protein YSA_05358 [Pseudomonas putida ND6]